MIKAYVTRNENYMELPIFQMFWAALIAVIFLLLIQEGQMPNYLEMGKEHFLSMYRWLLGPTLKFLTLLQDIQELPRQSHFQQELCEREISEKGTTGYLLGDAGYPCLSYLLTPFREPHTPGEQRYNQTHIQTRNVVERCFGVMKRMFSCLNRRLSTKVSTSCYIVGACGVLHNIALAQREIVEEPLQPPEGNIPGIFFL